MSYPIDFTNASADQVELALCERLRDIRLSRNMTQQQIAQEAGVSLRTIGRMENGEGVSLNTFIRVLAALGIHQNLETLLPDHTVRPMERIALSGSERKRASGKRSEQEQTGWSWEA